MKVGIVGAGVIGNRFGRVFSGIDQVEIHRVCDINIDRARVFAQKFGGTPTDNYKELLSDEEIDLVYIGVPPRHHKELTLQALQAGKDVICEKPIATSLKEADEMVSAASTSGRLTAINLPFRYTDGVLKMKELLDAGFVGKVRRVSLRFRFPRWPREWQDVDWLSGREQGGALREVGTHFFFLLWELERYVGKPKRVISLTDFPDAESAETGAVGMIELDSGIVCSVDLIIGGKEKEENTMVITGDSNLLSFEGWYLLKDIEGNVLCDTYKSAEAQMVMDFIASRRERLVSFEDARRAQQILEGLLTSGGKWVELN